MDYLRQQGILDPASEILWPVTVIGAGGIGTHAARTLAKMGFGQIRLYDPDIVEEHNRPNQSYRKPDIGKLKVLATKEIILEFAEDCQVETFPVKFESQELDGIVISAVDSMEARKTIWQKVKWNPSVTLFIDGRIGREMLEVRTIRPCQIEDIEAYEKTLFSDSEATPLPCTERGIIYVGEIIGGLIASQAKKWLKGEKFFNEIVFDLKTMVLLRDGK